MNCTYPVALNLRGKFCTVVGGGEVALRKVKSLLAQGAEVTVISPQLHQELSAMQSQFVWMKSPYKEVATEHFYREKTAKEIAEQTDKGIKTVQTQIYRAKGMIRKMMEGRAMR